MSSYVVNKCILGILDAIDRGVSTEEIRKNPTQYMISGKTKEIVINSGGEGLKLSPEIIEEMANRGDDVAKDILVKDKFRTYSNSSLKFAYLEDEMCNPIRDNPILIEIIKESKLKNTGGMDLVIYQVPVEDWAFKIREEKDFWGCEYIDSYIQGTCKIVK